LYSALSIEWRGARGLPPIEVDYNKINQTPPTSLFYLFDVNVKGISGDYDDMDTSSRHVVECTGRVPASVCACSDSSTRSNERPVTRTTLPMPPATPPPIHGRRPRVDRDVAISGYCRGLTTTNRLGGAPGTQIKTWRGYPRVQYGYRHFVTDREQEGDGPG